MPPPNSNDVLLARLNALKQSSVSLGTAPPTGASEITPDALRELGIEDDKGSAAAGQGDGDPILDLAARFKRLNGGKGPTGSEAAVEGAEGDGGEDKTLDELLRELGGERGDWDMGKEEEKDVGKLVREVRSVLPDVPTPGKEGFRREGEAGGAGKEKEREVEEEEVDQDALDEQEADDYIAQVLAELDLETKYEAEEDEGEQPAGSGEGEGGAAKEESSSSSKTPTEDAAWTPSKAPEGEDASAESSLSLPAAPTSLPTPPVMKDDFDMATAVDDALTARLAALSRDSPSPGPSGASSLPSAPSFAPSKKPPVKASKFTDEEIDSWCIICYANATVRCLGCDGDLYCQGCWNEGHRGESAGYEERTHRAVQFVKGGGLKKTPVGAG